MKQSYDLDVYSTTASLIYDETEILSIATLFSNRATGFSCAIRHSICVLLRQNIRLAGLSEPPE